MLNLTPLSVNNLIVYADTVSSGTFVGNYFTIVFTNTYSKQTFSVAASVVRRNARFVELEIELVGVNGLNNAINGQIYLYPEGNFEYMVFNTDQPTITLTTPLACAVWNTDTDFWNFAETIWNICSVNYVQIDRGQAFLYSDDPCEHEIEFVPYVGGNNLLESIVYVTNTPLFQFPCTIPTGTDYVVSQDTTTYCFTIIIEDGASLTVETGDTLKQTAAPYGYC